MAHGIIILGANGRGKSTLGRELARVLDFAHFDVEDYNFYISDIPYTAERPHHERNELMLSDMKKRGSLPNEQWRVITYPLGELKTYRFTAIFAQYGKIGGGWIYARHKNRDTWKLRAVIWRDLYANPMGD